MLDDVHVTMTKIDRAVRALRSAQVGLLKIREEMPMKSWCSDHVLLGVLQDNARAAANVAVRVASILDDALAKDKG